MLKILLALVLVSYSSPTKRHLKPNHHLDVCKTASSYFRVTSRATLLNRSEIGLVLASPVGIRRELHSQLSGFRGWNGADAGTNHRSVHLDLTRTAAATKAAGGDVDAMPGGTDKPVATDRFKGGSPVGPTHGDVGHGRRSGSRFTCCSNALASLSSSRSR